MIRLFGLLLLLTVTPAQAGKRLRGAEREAAIVRIDELLDQTQALHGQGDFEACTVAAREALELSRRALDALAPRLGTSLNNLGGCLEGAGAYAEAEPYYKQALDLRVESDRVSIEPVIVSCNNMGSVREAQGDVQDALEWYQTAWQFIIEYQVSDPVIYVVANNMASASTTLGDHETAETLYEWVLQSYELLHGHDHLMVAQAANNLAFLHVEMGRTHSAKVLFERALAIYAAQAPLHPDVANVHGNLGFMLQAEGDSQGARDHLERALQVRAAAYGPDHPETAVARMNLAGLLLNTGDNTATRREYEAALASLEESVGPEHPLVAVALSSLGAVCLEMGDYAEARPHLERAIGILEAAHGPEHAELAYPLYSLARLDHELGHYGQATASIDLAISLFTAAHGPSHPELGDMLIAQGATRMARGDHRGARGSYEQAVEVAAVAWGPDSPAVGHALNAFGALMLELGDIAGALDALQRARAILEAALGRGHVDTTAVLNNLAYTYTEQGSYVSARELYEQALAIEVAHFGPDHPEPAQILQNLGRLLLQQGDLIAARGHFERALHLKETGLGPTHPSVAITLDKLASVAALEGNHDEGRALLRRSLEIRREALGPEHPDLAHTHTHLAQLETHAGDYDTAAASYTAALELWGAAGMGGTESANQTRLALADLDLDLGRTDRAVAAMERARDEASGRYAPDEPAMVQVMQVLSQALAAQGRTDEARELVARSLSASEASIRPVLGRTSERARLALVRTHRGSLDIYLSLHDRPQDAVEAWQAVLRWKGVATRSLLQEASVASRSEDTELSTLLEELAGVRTAMATATWNGETAELAALTEDKERLQRAIAERSSSLATDFQVVEARPRDICQALPPGGVLVDLLRYTRAKPGQGTVHYDPHYTAFVVRAGACDQVARVDLGSAAGIDGAIERHRGLLTSGALSSRSDRAGASLRALIWDPLAEAIGEPSRVWIAPDGALATVAYAALPGPDGRYLLEDLTLGYLETAQDLLLDPTSAVGAGALVVGGVSYEGEALAMNLQPASATRPSATRAAACLEDLVPLPATLDEARGVAQALGDDVVLLTGQSASETRVAEAVAGKRYVHLATHGFFAGEGCRSALAADSNERVVLGMNPMLLSGLALAGANDGGTGRGDGIWTAEEIAALPLAGAELVVLSACDTALGTIEAGEGVLGLRRAFTMSGARTTTMSLWPVDDQATAWLMAELYGGLEGSGPVEALRQAQLALLAHNRATAGEARPETWAAFIASGGK